MRIEREITGDLNPLQKNLWSSKCPKCKKQGEGVYELFQKTETGILTVYYCRDCNILWKSNKNYKTGKMTKIISNHKLSKEMKEELKSKGEKDDRR